MVKRSRKTAKRSRSRSRRRVTHRRRRIQRQRGGNKVLALIRQQIASYMASESHPGIYYAPDEENLMKGKVMLVGPRFPGQSEADKANAKYPYEGCIFLFNFEFPADYPASPPKMQVVNAGYHADNPRIHPNLYALSGGAGYAGKVCLSVLGTWGQSSWTPTTNLEAVLATTQSILGPSPIHNEPGYESRAENDPQTLAYNHNACYYAIATSLAIFRQVLTREEEACDDNVKPFFDELKRHAFTSLGFYVRKLAGLKAAHPGGYRAVSELHHYAKVIDYAGLYDQALEVLGLVPEDLRVELTAENTSVRNENNARRINAEARRLAHLARTGTAVDPRIVEATELEAQAAAAGMNNATRTELRSAAAALRRAAERNRAAAAAGAAGGEGVGNAAAAAMGAPGPAAAAPPAAAAAAAAAANNNNNSSSNEEEGYHYSNDEEVLNNE